MAYFVYERDFAMRWCGVLYPQGKPPARLGDKKETAGGREVPDAYTHERCIAEFPAPPIQES